MKNIINLFIFYMILNDIYYTYSIQIVIQESLQYSVSILNLTNNQNKDR